MKVFFSVFPTLALCCWVNSDTVAGNTTAADLCHNTTNISVIPGELHRIPNMQFQDKNFSVSYEDSDAYFGISRLKDNHLGITVYSTRDNYSTLNLTLANGTCTYDIHIEVFPCPPGFSIINGICICNFPFVGDLPVVRCDNSTFKAKIFSGYCISESKQDPATFLIARCPLAISDSLLSAYILLENGTNGSLEFCKKFNRHGNLCGKCINTYGISVYSDTFKCTNCNNTRWKYIVRYIAIEIIPTTAFFLLVLYFHIGITSGPANGFIFFAQTVTSPFEVTFYRYIVTMFFKRLNDRYLPAGMVQSVIVPYSIWNLDFHRVFGSPSVCLSHDLRAIDILALRYLSTLYPFLLLLLCYIIIELQAMNVRPVLWMLKIICFPCVRWRRIWKAKISILDAFATYVLLSYNKVMYVTFLLLSKSRVHGHSPHSPKFVLGFDPSIQQYSGEHLPFLFLAVMIFLTFGLFPPLLLTFYQFKTCYSFLERARLKRPGLDQFVLAFQGCYKDGTNGTGDRRFFAGIYFVFRLVMVLVMTMSMDNSVVFGLKIISCIIFVSVCATVQPYKKAKYTIIDCIFLFILTLSSCLQYYSYILLQEAEKYSRNILLIQAMLYIPLMYMVLYVARWLFLCFKNKDPNRYLLLNDGELKDALSDEREGNREPVHIDISPRPSITRTEVSIAELSQENHSESENDENETTPLVGKRREMKIFSQHAATLSDEYRLARNS